MRLWLTGMMLCVLLLVGSCACLDCYRPPQTLCLRVDGRDAYTVVSADPSVNVQREDGRFIIDLPGKTYGYMLILFVVPVGNTDPEDKEQIVLQRNQEDVRRITVAQLRRLPRDDDGTIVLKIK